MKNLLFDRGRQPALQKFKHFSQWTANSLQVKSKLFTKGTHVFLVSENVFFRLNWPSVYLANSNIELEQNQCLVTYLNFVC